MWHDRSRAVVLAILLTGTLSAQAPAPEPRAPSPVVESKAQGPVPKGPAQISKGRAKGKPLPGRHASVKPEVAAKSQARSKELKVGKAMALPRGPAVGINSGSKEALKRLPGMTEAYANAIIAKRPYKTRTELITRDVIPAGLYQALKGRLVTK